MKTTILAMVAAFGLTAGAASADDFDNTVASVTAEFSRYDLTIEGTEDDSYTELSFGANIVGGLDMSVTHYHAVDAYGIGLDYTATTQVGAVEVWGVAEVEYVALDGDLDGGDFFATPTVGAGYDVTNAVTVWSEVGYTWNASESFDRVGGVAEVGVDFTLAENVTLTPSVVRTFDTGADESQLNLNLTFNF